MSWLSQGVDFVKGTLGGGGGGSNTSTTKSDVTVTPIVNTNTSIDFLPLLQAIQSGQIAQNKIDNLKVASDQAGINVDAQKANALIATANKAENIFLISVLTLSFVFLVSNFKKGKK
jgi:hypothetical protein